MNQFYRLANSIKREISSKIDTKQFIKAFKGKNEGTNQRYCYNISTSSNSMGN